MSTSFVTWNSFRAVTLFFSSQRNWIFQDDDGDDDDDDGDDDDDDDDDNE